ncbi:B12-binding domain-containing radical SAM protein [Rhizobium leguminosarum]
MNISKILLVNVGMDTDVSAIANDGSFPALGVVSLATVLRRDHPEIDVIAIDGQVTPRQEVEALIHSFAPELVGFSVLGSSFKNSLYLAEVAKSRGAVTVFGNDHAAALGRQIMKRRPMVDFICTADIGEFAFSALVDFLKGGRAITAVPRLMYRVGDEIRHNDLPEVNYVRPDGSFSYVLDTIPIPDRTLLPQHNWSAYLNSYLSRYGTLHADEIITGVTTMNRARGCARAKNPCNFCGIADLTPRFSSPAFFWEDVRRGISDVSASIFYEAFDSFSSAPRWIEDLVRAKPKDVGDPRFFVYTQAAETNARIVTLYKELGVYRVNMGLEAGDTGMLKRLKGSRDSLEKNQEACILFKEAGLPIYGSLVLGGQGETYESLANTIDFAKWLIDNDMMAALEAQPLYPDFGALTGRWLTNPWEARQAAVRQDFSILNDRLLDSMPAKYGDTDEIDFDEISYEWNQIFCHVSWEDLLLATAEITGYAAKHNTVAGSARMSSSQLRRARVS